MYIYKMVFQDYDEIPVEALKEADLIYDTDYGTTEILADTYKDFMENAGKDKVTGSRDEILKQEIIGGLGTEIHEAFMNDELDLVLVVYD